MPEQRSPGIRGLATITALLAWGALALQLYLSTRLAVANGRTVWWGVVMYLGYFTLLTNVLVALALTLALRTAPPRTSLARFFTRPSITSAIAAYIALVGLVYNLVLRRLWHPTGLELVADELLHVVVPVLFLVYWLLAVPKHDLRARDAVEWTVYPIAYFAYALGRGALLHVYPYPFIDVGQLGYMRVMVNAVAMLVGFTVVALILIAAGRAAASARARAAP